MPTLQSPLITLHIPDDATSLTLEDRPRHTAWQLSPPHPQAYAYNDQLTPIPLSFSHVEKLPDAIRLHYHLHDTPITYTWSLHQDHARVTLQTTLKDIEYLSLPGSFLPVSATTTSSQAQALPCLGSGGSTTTHLPHQLAIPYYQGLLLSHRPNDWYAIAGHHGHHGLTMSMLAHIASGGALLLTHDSDANWKAHFGQQAGNLFAYFRHHHCPVEGWPDATVRLYPTAPSLTAICKRYKQRLIERNLFKSWPEKIAEKPILQNLFGALFAFIGYNQPPAPGSLDYLASARALKSHGFKSIFYFPARFCAYSDNFQMGGDAPIHLSDQDIAALRAIPNTYLSPWTWLIEALDESTAPERRHLFRHDINGQPIPNWKIDDYQWYWACTPYQIDHLKHRLASDMSAMDWLHFDVSAMLPGMPCFNTAHAHHAHKPMGRRADLAWTQQLFSKSTVGNRLVSSEGLSDHYAPFYDVGSTKMIPPADFPAHTTLVPMSSLVLHDSVIHDWWEVHNYNPNPGFPLSNLPGHLGQVGSGQPHQKAALDALHGYPPSLFPFGKQYAWIDIEKRTTYSFLIRLEDAPVQEAISCALPVAKLHERIGPQEMLDFQLLSDDGLLQSTTFADGTQITANLNPTPATLPTGQTLPPHAWQATHL